MDKGQKRKNTIIYVIVAASLLLISQLAYLQIFDVEGREKAKRAALSSVTLYPSRGLIYDRNEKLLVTNIPIYDINVIYRNIDPKMDTTLFCRLLNITKEQFKENLNKDWKSPQYSKNVPFTFLTRINPETYAAFQEHLHKFPGFYPVLKNIRAYPYPNAAHVLGYLGEISKETLEKSEDKYSAGDYIGVSGIEKAYEEKLKGEKGVSYVFKDNLGRIVGPYNDGKLDKSPISGYDLISTIDIDLQQYGEQLMQNKRGSIVAIEPKTGEILAMISAPTYDPNILRLDRDRKIAFNELLNDSINRPFLDRSVMAKYPPGSIFKTVVSLIAMQTGISDPNRYIPCSGAYALDSRGTVQRCHSHPPALNVSLALAYSCNSYYFQLMRELVNRYGYKNPGAGLDTFVNYLNRFGLGTRLGIDYSFESPGFIPNSSYYDRLYSKVKSGWRATFMLSVGIGQGELQITTLQMANLASIIANRGYYITPHLVKGYRNYNEPIEEKFRKKNFVGIDEKYFEPVIKGMESAVIEGTARVGYISGISVCGKTGTSENPHGADHSVFFAFAPKDDPKIAIAVFIENAGFGASHATPIASLMIEKYLTGQISPYRKYLEERMLKANLINHPRT